MKLSDDLKKWRSDRPDEWTMGRFIEDASALEKRNMRVINLLKRLSDEISYWHSECDCHASSEMRGWEVRIDEFIEWLEDEPEDCND